MVQNDKTFCLLHSISQELYIIWLSFMVQMCKIISPGVFFKFKISIFWVVRGLKGQKMTQSDKKFCLSHSVSQEPYIIWLWSSYDVHHMTAFLIIICFSSSSINGKKKFWGVPHLLHLWVIFYQQYLLSENDMLPNFYITSSTPQNELSPTPRKGKKNKVE